MQKNKRFSVYWFNPEPTIGTELRKVRPCVVVSPEDMNEVISTVIIVPLTSRLKAWPFRTEVKIGGKKSSVACDQIRAVDKSRLKEFIAMLSPNESKSILQVLQETFAD
jgi:mRNA interferase MazF